MIKRNFKIILAYITGIIVSMFLAVPLSPILGFSPVLFSIVTGLITIWFVYSKIWKTGKYDALKKTQSYIKPLLSMTAFIIISFFIILVVAIYEPKGNIDITMVIGTFWFFPFMSFFTKTSFVYITPIVVAAFLILSEIAYYAGTKGFSLTDRFFAARKKRLDKKAIKHKEEIEKIKEEYKNKKCSG